MSHSEYKNVSSNESSGSEIYVGKPLTRAFEGAYPKWLEHSGEQVVAIVPSPQKALYLTKMYTWYLNNYGESTNKAAAIESQIPHLFYGIKTIPVPF